MVFQYEQGFKFSDFVDPISKAYGIKPEALKRDWGRRKKWLPLLAQIDDKKFRISKIAMRIRAIMKVSWETYRSARKVKNHNAMVGAIEKLIRVSQHEVDILKSLGVFEKEPVKIDALVTSPRPMEWEQIPEVAEAVAKIREKLRKEKEAANNEQPT